jgi:hypothetical protein
VRSDDIPALADKNFNALKHIVGIHQPLHCLLGFFDFIRFAVNYFLICTLSEQANPLPRPRARVRARAGQPWGRAGLPEALPPGRARWESGGEEFALLVMGEQCRDCSQWRKYFTFKVKSWLA